MKLMIVVHEAGEGGYWAEVPAIAGCVSQGESLGELLENIREAIEGCLSVKSGPRSFHRSGHSGFPFSILPAPLGRP